MDSTFARATERADSNPEALDERPVPVRLHILDTNGVRPEQLEETIRRFVVLDFRRYKAPRRVRRHDRFQGQRCWT